MVANKFLFFIFITFVIYSAHADIMYLNMNDPYACEKNQPENSEIKKIKEAAQERGEKVIIMPSCSSAKNLSTDLTKTAWNDFSRRICEMLDGVNKSAVTSLVISGHDGGGSFGGAVGAISNPAIRELFGSNNFPNLKGVYLLGCYTNVPFEAITWDGVFSQAKIVAGFDDKSPLNGNPELAATLKELLLIEKQIPENELQTKLKSLYSGLSLKLATSFKAPKDDCNCTTSFYSSSDNDKNPNPQFEEIQKLKDQCSDPSKIASLKKAGDIIACYRYANVHFPPRDSQNFSHLEPKNLSKHPQCADIPVMKDSNDFVHDDAELVVEKNETKCANYPNYSNGKDEVQELRDAYAVERQLQHCISSETPNTLFDGQFALSEDPNMTLGLVKFKEVFENYNHFFAKDLAKSKEAIAKMNAQLPKNERINISIFNANATRASWLNEIEKLRKINDDNQEHGSNIKLRKASWEQVRHFLDSSDTYILFTVNSCIPFSWLEKTNNVNDLKNGMHCNFDGE